MVGGGNRKEPSVMVLTKHGHGGNVEYHEELVAIESVTKPRHK